MLSLEPSIRIHMFLGESLPKNLAGISYQGIKWYAIKQGTAEDRDVKKEGYI